MALAAQRQVRAQRLHFCDRHVLCALQGAPLHLRDIGVVLDLRRRLLALLPALGRCWQSGQVAVLIDVLDRVSTLGLDQIAALHSAKLLFQARELLFCLLVLRRI